MHCRFGELVSTFELVPLLFRDCDVSVGCETLDTDEKNSMDRITCGGMEGNLASCDKSLRRKSPVSMFSSLDILRNSRATLCILGVLLYCQGWNGRKGKQSAIVSGSN